MSNAGEGEVIASLCAFVILGIRIPFEVEVISSSDDAFGDSVPIPTAPVDGNMF